MNDDESRERIDDGDGGARPSFANVAIGYLKRTIDTTFSYDQSSGSALVNRYLQTHPDAEGRG